MRHPPDRRYAGLLLFAAIALHAAVGFAADGSTRGLPSGDSGAVGMDAAPLAEIPERMRQFVEDAQIAGAVTLVARRGRIVHLDLKLSRLKKRLDDIDARGVVIGPDQNLGDLYAERQPLYLKYADITISTDGLTPDQVVVKIMQTLMKPAD